MMRMNSFPGIIPWTACIGMFLLLSGCTSEPEVTYGLQPLELQASTADKDRVKSIEQWITILIYVFVGFWILAFTSALYEFSVAYSVVQYTA